MGKSDRGRSKGLKNNGVWYWVYFQRMQRGLEYCRECGLYLPLGNNGVPQRRYLTFDHILPASKGGQLSFYNITIMCNWCNENKADEDWSSWYWSLSDEEYANPHRAFATNVYRAIGAIDFEGFYDVVPEESIRMYRVYQEDYPLVLRFGQSSMAWESYNDLD